MQGKKRDTNFALTLIVGLSNACQIRTNARYPQYKQRWYLSGRQSFTHVISFKHDYIIVSI